MPSITVDRARWWVLTLLFVATTINYLDRIVFSVLVPVIRDELHLSTEQYGYINGAFQIAYTVGFSSQSHMTTAFGKLRGQTPGAYRSPFKTTPKYLNLFESLDRTAESNPRAS